MYPLNDGSYILFIFLWYIFVKVSGGYTVSCGTHCVHARISDFIETDITQGKTAWQIPDEGYMSADAIDGRLTTCTQTAAVPASFWAVDLGAIVGIGSVVVRMDDANHGGYGVISQIL